MLGMFFVSYHANASFFSNVFGISVSANTQVLKDKEKNSQNMALLQANVSSSVASKDKKDKESVIEDGNENINIVSNNALSPIVGPLGVSDGTEVNDFSNDQVSVYVVKPGDTISQIAEMFNVSLNTIYWANENVERGKPLRAGEIIVILPVSGIEHTITKGDTLPKIAKKYNVDVRDITFYNGITENTKLVAGDKIMVPGAEIDVPETSSPNSNSKPNSGSYVSAPVKDTSGYFVYPTVSSAKRSRGITRTHKGVDLAAPVGTPIYAAASGTVILARSSDYNGGFGKMIIIQHSNGTQTIYAHLSALYVQNGAQVTQGQNIGDMGNTGRSTGSHLHFEVKGGINPF